MLALNCNYSKFSFASIESFPQIFLGFHLQLMWVTKLLYAYICNYCMKAIHEWIECFILQLLLLFHETIVQKISFATWLGIPRNYCRLSFATIIADFPGYNNIIVFCNYWRVSVKLFFPNKLQCCRFVFVTVVDFLRKYCCKCLSSELHYLCHRRRIKTE